MYDGKFPYKSIPKNTNIITSTSILPQESFQATNDSLGQHLHMDYGFVRGSDWSRKENDGTLVSSVDKYRSYLLVIDRHTRYIWIYLTKSKHPPIEQVSGLLRRFSTFTYATITTDRGGELASSFAFQKLTDSSN